MASRSPQLLRFQRDEPAAVVAAIADLRQSRDGWVNFRPFDEELDGDPRANLDGDPRADLDGDPRANLDGAAQAGHAGRSGKPKGSAWGIGGLLLKPAPPMPVCTWVPGEDHKRKGRLPDSVGLQHPGGRKAGPALVAEGVTLPTGWRVMSDNARRGLVLTLPNDSDAEQAVRWLLRAATILTPFQLPSDWIAEIHRS